MPQDERRPSAVPFFVLTFALSWTVWVPLMLQRVGLVRIGVPTAALVPLALPGVLMPSVAALILSRHRRGGARALLRRLGVWRVGWGWWAAVLLVQPALLGLVALLANAIGIGEKVVPVSAAGLSGLPLTFVFLCIASAGEELGWRGHALPVLQATHSPLRSGLVLGLVTATWHLPYWALQGVLEDYGALYIVADYLFIVALTLQLVVVFNRTREGVLLPVVFHVVFNAFNVALLPVTSNVGAFTLLTVAECIIAGAMVAASHGGRTAEPIASVSG